MKYQSSKHLKRKRLKCRRPNYNWKLDTSLVQGFCINIARLKLFLKNKKIHIKINEVILMNETK